MKSPVTPIQAVGQRGGTATNVTKFYNETCAPCHGIEGQGGGAGTRTLNTRELFDQSHDRPFFDAIKNGVHDMAMPAYGATLSDEEIWAQVVHVRELQSRALRNAEGYPKAENGVYRSKLASFRVEDFVTSGLTLPWGLEALPDGRMLVTNRRGTLHLIGKDGTLGPAITGTPPVIELGQGGLMDVAPAPDFAQSGWIYLSLADPKKDGSKQGLTKIVRGKLDPTGTKWTDQQTIWEAPQEFYTGAGIHFGSKIAFDGKGHVFFSVGERGSNERAQSPEVPWGRIYRLNLDGSVPKDNPFVGKPGWFEGTWTYGHRNPQGLAFGLDGRLWDTEHAPRGGDELNELRKGENYGWPLVVYGINYNDTPFRTPFPEISAPGQKIAMPILRWLPSIATSGLETVRGDAFPAWRGDLIAGGLAGQTLQRIRTKDGALVEHEEILGGMGRVRDVAVGPDGIIYVVLNDPDKIVRLVPTK